jgi:hypothetical protein
MPARYEGPQHAVSEGTKKAVNLPDLAWDGATWAFCAADRGFLVGRWLLGRGTGHRMPAPWPWAEPIRLTARSSLPQGSVRYCGITGEVSFLK